MGLENHPSFDRPPVSTRLWRYTDLPKFLELLSTSTLWLSNAEVLAASDPYEGLPNALQFPHRMWSSIDKVPEQLRIQILDKSGSFDDPDPEKVFRGWFMGQEQRCIMTQFGRRDYFINCWHAADVESTAMWKIYSEPGAGVALVTNGARLEEALSENEEKVYLGAVQYIQSGYVEIGSRNAFDPLLKKRNSYAFEQEVRLVHWKTGDYHDPLSNFAWNDETMRFDDIVEDPRPLQPGIALSCDIGALVECIIVSPFAPAWYEGLIKRLSAKFGFSFPIQRSRLLSAPPQID